MAETISLIRRRDVIGTTINRNWHQAASGIINAL